MKNTLITLPVMLVMATHALAELPDNYSVSFESAQTIEGVAPEMLDWWWNSIRTEERFVEWNPEHHLAFELTSPPAIPNSPEYSLGTEQQVSTLLNGFTVNNTVTWRPAFEGEPQQRQLTAEIAFTGFEDLSFPGNGWLIYNYDRNPDDLSATTVSARVLLPDVANAVFPGIGNSLREHVETDLNNIADFLPELFQTEFIEEELESRGSYRVEKNGYWLKTVTVDQEIKGLTPAMMNWWWDNINNTQRYMQWHPTAHLSFEWLEAPESPNNTTYSVGAVQRVVEYLGPYKNALLITWLPKEDAADRVEYEHWLYAQTDLDGLSGILPQDMIHEYQMNDAGDGIVMRSTFNVPFFLDWVMPDFTSELGKHALQEMQMLQYFLPELFAEQALE